MTTAFAEIIVIVALTIVEDHCTVRVLIVELLNIC